MIRRRVLFDVGKPNKLEDKSILFNWINGCIMFLGHTNCYIAKLTKQYCIDRHEYTIQNNFVMRISEIIAATVFFMKIIRLYSRIESLESAAADLLIPTTFEPFSENFLQINSVFAYDRQLVIDPSPP